MAADMRLEMPKEASPADARPGLGRRGAFAAGILLAALVGLIPLHHRLWPVSVLMAGAIPLTERIRGRDAVGGRESPRGRPLRDPPRRAGTEPIASRLAELQAEGYRILRHVDPGAQGVDQIDQVVVGPTGVFVVRVNTWSGRFSVRRDGWFCHTRRDAGELVWEVTREVMAVKGHLHRKKLGGQVHGIVAVARSQMSEPVIHMGRVTFVEASRAIDYIRSRRPTLSAEQVTQTAAGMPA